MSRSDDLAAALDPLAGDGPQATPDGDERTTAQLRAALAAEPTWDEPPAGLRERLLTRALEESAGLPGGARDAQADGARDPQADGARDAQADGARDPQDTAEPGTLRPDELAEHRRRRRGRGRVVPTWLAATAGAAAATLAVVTLGPVVSGLRPDGQTQVVALAGTELAPEADVTALVDEQSAGFAITLEITGLPPAPAGTYYAAWLRGPDGAVPAGTFHWREGGVPIELWSGVDPADYPELVVVLQDEGAPVTQDEEQAYLVGRLDAPVGRGGPGDGA